MPSFASSSTLSLWLLCSTLAPNAVSSFSSVRVVESSTLRRRHGLVVLRQASNNDNDSSSSSSYPFFQMQQIPTATSGKGLDHIVECAETGECDVEEMMRMIDELEQLNKDCEGTHSRECNLDAVAARNVLKVALASKIAVEDALQECEMLLEELDREHGNPFSELHELHDECVSELHQLPTATASSASQVSLDRIVQCAEQGECPVGELDDMVEELERLNQACEHELSRECSLQAVEARNILKVSLASQAAMAREVLARNNNNNKKSE